MNSIIGLVLGPFHTHAPHLKCSYLDQIYSNLLWQRCSTCTILPPLSWRSSDSTRFLWILFVESFVSLHSVRFNICHQTQKVGFWYILMDHKWKSQRFVNKLAAKSYDQTLNLERSSWQVVSRHRLTKSLVPSFLNLNTSRNKWIKSDRVW